MYHIGPSVWLIHAMNSIIYAAHICYIFISKIIEFHTSLLRSIFPLHRCIHTEACCNHPKKGAWIEKMSKSKNNGLDRVLFMSSAKHEPLARLCWINRRSCYATLPMSIMVCVFYDCRRWNREFKTGRSKSEMKVEIDACCMPDHAITNSRSKLSIDSNACTLYTACGDVAVVAVVVVMSNTFAQNSEWKQQTN